MINLTFCKILRVYQPDSVNQFFVELQKKNSERKNLNT